MKIKGFSLNTWFKYFLVAFFAFVERKAVKQWLKEFEEWEKKS